jgi:hypothetical protein
VLSKDPRITGRPLKSFQKRIDVFSVCEAIFCLTVQEPPPKIELPASSLAAPLPLSAPIERSGLPAGYYDDYADADDRENDVKVSISFISVSDKPFLGQTVFGQTVFRKTVFGQTIFGQMVFEQTIFGEFLIFHDPKGT